MYEVVRETYTARDGSYTFRWKIVREDGSLVFRTVTKAEAAEIVHNLHSA